MLCGWVNREKRVKCETHSPRSHCVIFPFAFILYQMSVIPQRFHYICFVEFLLVRGYKKQSESFNVQIKLAA